MSRKVKHLCINIHMFGGQQKCPTSVNPWDAGRSRAAARDSPGIQESHHENVKAAAMDVGKNSLPSASQTWLAGKSPCSSWVNPLFLWSFSITMLNYQRVPCSQSWLAGKCTILLTGDFPKPRF